MYTQNLEKLLENNSKFKHTKIKSKLAKWKAIFEHTKGCLNVIWDRLAICNDIWMLFYMCQCSSLILHNKFHFFYIFS